MSFVQRVLSGVRRRLRIGSGLPGSGWAASYGGAYRSPDETTRFALAEVTRIASYVGGFEALRGRALLEIGPGMDLGVPLLAAGLGAEAFAIDRYPCPFDPSVHPEVYRLLAERAAASLPNFDSAPIRDCLEAGAHRSRRLHWVDCGLEDLLVDRRGIPTGGIDITYSNATFEHLADGATALRALFEVTAPGGVGFHQIDLRDHRDFSRPLEYLTLSPEEFAAFFARVEGSCGNRLRGQQFERLARDVGFEAALLGNMDAAEGYLDELMPRLHAASSGWPRDWYRIISGRLVVRRPGASRFAIDVDGRGDPLASSIR
jgi:hypothetical protein